MGVAMKLEKRWATLWKEAAPNRVTETFAALKEHYNEKGRAYHNLDHITSCIQQLGGIYRNRFALSALALEVALWYHDVIYDPQRKDNEEQSAAFALGQMRDQLGVARHFQERVTRLIIATKHNKHVESAAEQTIVDIDLHTLGGSPEEYEAYAKAIRQEYDWVPEADYIKGRTAVLQSFLDRPFIYYTDHFRHRYEQNARRNLAEEIARLNRA